MVVLQMVTQIPASLLGVECDGNHIGPPRFADQLWPLLESYARDLAVYEFGARRRLFRRPPPRSIRHIGSLAALDRKSKTHVCMSSWYGGHLSILYETKNAQFPSLLIRQWPRIRVAREIDFGVSINDATTLIEFVSARPVGSFCFSFFHDGAPLIAFASAIGPFASIVSGSG
jgi:hypothetical protein